MKLLLNNSVHNQEDFWISVGAKDPEPGASEMSYAQIGAKQASLSSSVCRVLQNFEFQFSKIFTYAFLFLPWLHLVYFKLYLIVDFMYLLVIQRCTRIFLPKVMNINIFTK